MPSCTEAAARNSASLSDALPGWTRTSAMRLRAAASGVRALGGVGPQLEASRHRSTRRRAPRPSARVGRRIVQFVDRAPDLDERCERLVSWRSIRWNFGQLGRGVPLQLPLDGLAELARHPQSAARRELSERAPRLRGNADTSELR